MNIQANINQVLSIAGLLAGQTPMAANQRAKYMEKQKVKEAYKDFDKYEDLAEEGRDIELEVEDRASKVKENTGREPTLDQKIQWAKGEATAQGFIAAKGKSAAQKVFEADPTEKNYEKFALNATGPAEVERQKETYISGLEEEKARINQEKEQSRLARSAILEGIYTGSAPRTEKDTERITAARGGY